MELEKQKITRWKIKDEKLAPIEITTIENEGTKPEFSLHLSDITLTLPEFIQYMDYLNHIRTLFDPSNSNPDPMENPINQEDNSALLSSSNIIPLTLPKTVDIPEIFIFAPTGLCLFHFEFYRRPNPNPLNQNLISGLFTAINIFADRMGWKDGLNLIRADNVEVRFHKGESIIIAVLSNREMKINYLIEPILEDLAIELTSTFEKEYQEVLDLTVSSGISNPNQFSTFSNSVDRIFITFRKQTFELYQKLILHEAMYFEIPTDKCTRLIHQLSEGRSVVNELGELMKKYPKIKLAIKKINYEQRALWNLFKTPIYDV
ncbi:MAG: hypothetical protein ACTSYI_02755 [Promethearchaeota archaeon]